MILLKMIDHVTQKKTLHYLTSGNKLEGDVGDCRGRHSLPTGSNVSLFSAEGEI